MLVPKVTDRLKEAPAMVLRTVFAGIGQLLMAADKVRAQLQEQLAPEPHHSPAGQAESGRPQPEATGKVTLLADRQGPGGQRAHTRPASPATPAAGRAPGSAAAPPPAATAAKPATRTARQAATKREPARPATAQPAPARRTAAKPVPARGTAKPAPAKPAAAEPVPAGQAPAEPAPAKPAPAKGTAAKPPPARRTAAKPAATKPAPAKPAATKSATTPAASPAPAPPFAGYDGLSVASLRARLRGQGPDGVQAMLAYERATAHRDDVITMYERRLARLAGETG